MHSYDVVTMSLVLSYLPTPEAREVIIEKARQLLRTPSSSSTVLPHYSGLLLIVEKISIFHHPNYRPPSTYPSLHSPTVSLWREVISDMGFSSLVYQLLSFPDNKKAHAFAFCNRKKEKEGNSLDEGEGEVAGVMGKRGKRMWIKQDFYISEEKSANKSDADDKPAK
ncbi:hypothetical protein EON63_14730 [archaeon]|nr:MAG: hypothetical protein EON63_14730 [archaeon]